MTNVPKHRHRRDWFTQSRYRVFVYVMTYSSFMFGCGLFVGITSR